MIRYKARSASERTDDWPFWYVADTQRDDLNVTVSLAREIAGEDGGGYMFPFLPRKAAERLAAQANAA